jgi:hypothetical protein
MNITKQTISQIEEIVSISFWKGSNESTPEKADSVYLGYFVNGECLYITIKCPKKQEVTLEWVKSKIEKSLSPSTKSNLHRFDNLATLIGGCSPNLYGLGKSNWFEKDDNDEIDNKLNEMGIEYKKEYSLEHFVIRYKISTKKENLEKIKAL